MLGEIVERVPHRLAPGAVPAEPARLAIGEGLAGDHSCPMRQRQRPAVELDRFVEPAANAICAVLPPQRQRVVEQPAPQRRRLAHDVAHMAAPDRRRVRQWLSWSEAIIVCGARAQGAVVATGPCRRKLLLQEAFVTASFWHFFRFILEADGISGAQAAARRSGVAATSPCRPKGRHLGEPILVTGVAGFIGMHVARRLLSDGHDVVGVDNLNAYYDPGLKQARVAALEAFHL